MRRRLIFVKVYRIVGYLSAAFGLMGIVGALSDKHHPSDTVGVVVTSLIFVMIGLTLIIRSGRARRRITQHDPNAIGAKATKAKTPGTLSWRMRTLFRTALLTPAGAFATIVAVVASIKIPAAHVSPIIFYSAVVARKVFAQEAVAQRAQVAALTPDEKLKICLASGESEPFDRDTQLT